MNTIPFRLTALAHAIRAIYPPLHQEKYYAIEKGLFGKIYW